MWSQGIFRHFILNYCRYVGYVIIIINLLRVKVKVSPLQATGDVDARVHIHTTTALGRGRVVVCSAAFTPRKLPGIHFIGGWVDYGTSLDTKEWRKIPTPQTPGIKPEPSSPQPSASPLEPPCPFLLRVRSWYQHFYASVLCFYGEDYVINSSK